jgi:FkbM family methyltransferase
MKNHSQLGQDLWVLEKLRYKRNGFFVEAGACDGVYLSNTFLLEKIYGWKGICCEPNIQYYEMLQINRNCIFDNRVLYDSDHHEIEFYPSGENGGTYEDFAAESARLEQRVRVGSYPARTVSLNTLLERSDAPSTIDYISLDTEGSELKILKDLNYDQWDVRIFSVEHNSGVGGRVDDSYLNEIREFLASKGYEFELNKWDSYFFKGVEA